MLVAALAASSEATLPVSKGAVPAKPAQAGVTAKPARAAAAAKPARALPDAAVERNIRAKFAKSKINSEHFTVSVKDGVATIEGKTSVIQHKGVATRLAKTGGAAAVANHIEISEEAKAKAAARLAKYRQQGPVARAVVIPAKK